MPDDSLERLGGWPTVLSRLTAHEDLDRPTAAAAMAEILDGNATPAQIAGFIIALRMKGETVEELTGLVNAMTSRAVRVDLERPDGVIDLVGTGGDRSHSINVSTLAALTVVGAGGRVCKHGNRAASSACGTADLLEAFGMAFDLGPEGVARCVDTVDFGFCFAPRFHAAIRHAGPARRELGVPTVFNFLGPLSNPAGVRRQVTGVADPAMAERMIGVLRANGSERALVVYGHDGLDELTITTTSTVLDLRDGEIRSYELDPTDFGIPLADLDRIRGGDASVNAAISHRILAGETGPATDIVVLNAAAGLIAAGIAENFPDGIDAARSALSDGAAAAALEAIVTESRAAAAAGL